MLSSHPIRWPAAAIILLIGFGVAAQPFEGLSSAIQQGQFGQLKAVVIARHGDIIYEDYFRGTQPDDLHQVQSVTKSVGSALVGIAHRQGKLQLDQGLDEFFGELYPMTQGSYRDKADITVEQVLQQRHGIQWDEAQTDYRDPQNPANQLVNASDWYDFVLTRPMDAAPGTRFSYSTGASTLMSRFIRVASGMGPEAFAMQELFAPLGIDSVHWEGFSEDGRGTGLTDWPNPDGDAPLGFSLWLSARDMVKFGELYLRGGVYNGRRILDSSWVDASWTKYSNASNSDEFEQPGWGHGYQWWIATVDDPLGRHWNVFFASGWGSQVIFIIPELDLVMVTTADNYDHTGFDVDALLVTQVLPFVAPRLDARFNGAWYDPAADGQGLTLEIRDGSVLGFWYTYDQAGGQRWFLMQGQVSSGFGQVTIYETSGGVFLQGTPPYSLIPWGSGLFSAVDCDHIRFDFDADQLSETVQLTRLSGVCFSPPE